MKTIWKYEVSLQSEFSIAMPKGALILSVQSQKGIPNIWAIVETNNDIETRNFILSGTGHTLFTENIKYIGTFQMQEGVLVFHLFEKL